MSEPEDHPTKLPDINNKKGELKGFVGETREGSKENKRSIGPMSGNTHTMSRQSSRKSIPMSNHLRSTGPPMIKNRTLNHAKQDRVQVEKDAELLANRIALLKQEEIRTWKKIEETRKRARDVLEMKRKNEERIKK